MPKANSQPHHPIENTSLLVIGLIEKALMARRIEDLASDVLPSLARLMRSYSVLLYIVDSQPIASRIFPHGFPSEVASELEVLCAEKFDQLSSQTERGPVSVAPPPDGKIAADLVIYPLWVEDRCIGLTGWTMTEEAPLTSPELIESLLPLLANAIIHLLVQLQTERQLSELNAYLTVSSMLAQSLGLHELLEIALYCCMELVSAEEASVLLLDDEKENFRIYHVEGVAKPALEGATFPADVGLAGSVLQSQHVEVINDVQHDPRFYEKMDQEFGYPTRNMIALPLVAGEEPVGVLEVINKAGGASFTDDESLLLLSISEEIAFAIRNAKVFEYVVNSYCKQRQGQPSCKGCERPLGSWTPCVKYREVSI